MDIKELKEILKNSTSVLILEDGHPLFVVFDYAVYREMLLNKTDISKSVEVPVTRDKSISQNEFFPVTTRSRAFKHSSIQEKEVEILERLNKEIMELKHQIEQEERTDSVQQN